MKPTEYFDAAKRVLKIESDYELAKHLGIPNANIPGMRDETRRVSLDVAFKLAIALEMDPATVVADLESQREKNEARRGFWRSFISHARTAAVLLACMLAWNYSAICGAGSGVGAGFFRRPKDA